MQPISDDNAALHQQIRPQLQHPAAFARQRTAPNTSGAPSQPRPMSSAGDNPGASTSASTSGSISRASRGATSTSRFPKLDGVIYHFYAKTSAVLTSSRLTHYEPYNPEQASATEAGSSHTRYGSLGSQGEAKGAGGTGRKISKWVSARDAGLHSMA